MEALRDQFLTGSAFADHQYRAVERSCPAGAFQRVEKGSRLPDNLRRPFHAHDLVYFPNVWQVQIANRPPLPSENGRFLPFFGIGTASAIELASPVHRHEQH